MAEDLSPRSPLPELLQIALDEIQFCQSKFDPETSNMRPRESFSEFAFFFAKDLAKDFNMRPLRKVNVGFAKDSGKSIFQVAVCR